MVVRAKFRCMSITQHAEFCSEVRLLPVEPKGEAYPEGCLENQAFWDATPSGEVKIWYRLGVPIPQILGAYYYIDMEQAEAGDQLWKLWKVKPHEDHQMDINMGLGWSEDRPLISHAELEMQILNPTVFPIFADQKDTKWSVDISQAG